MSKIIDLEKYQRADRDLAAFLMFAAMCGATPQASAHLGDVHADRISPVPPIPTTVPTDPSKDPVPAPGPTKIAEGGGWAGGHNSVPIPRPPKG